MNILHNQITTSKQTEDSENNQNQKMAQEEELKSPIVASNEHQQIQQQLSEEELVVVEQLAGVIDLCPTDLALSMDNPHPLNSEWTLWFDGGQPRGGPKSSAADSWGANLKEIIQVKTVEDFWGGSNYHLFRSGIKPEWEDKANAGGGKWSIELVQRQDIDKLWMRCCLALIGETSEYSDQVNGCVVSNKRGQFRLAIWIRRPDSQERNSALGRQLQEIIEVKESLKFSEFR